MRLKFGFAAAALLCGGMLAASPAVAQMAPLSDPVVAHPDPESLFSSKDPKLNRNKQAAYHIVKELLQCDEWSRSGEWLTKRYIQHNPFAASGLDGVINYFTNVLKRQPKADCSKLTSPVVAVQAEGDYVTVLYVREYPLPGNPTKTYNSTWFDTWRFVDGKADEHWDPAILPAYAPPATGSVDAALQRQKDRDAIEELMWRYDRALDSFNPDAYAALFTEDGSFGPNKGHAALHKMIADLAASRAERKAKGENVPGLYHGTSNQWVEFLGADRAKVHYYWQTYFAGKAPQNPPVLEAVGNGLDEVVKINGKWFLRSRDVAAAAD